MVGLISVATCVSDPARKRRGDRRAIRRLCGKDARHRIDFASAQQLGKTDLAAQHVGPGAARHDHVVGRAKAQILPKLVGQRLGALQEERLPVVAGVEHGLGLRTAASAVSCRVPGISSTVAPCARICTVFAGLVDAGAMIVARMPAGRRIGGDRRAAVAGAVLQHRSHAPAGAAATASPRRRDP
jgi:hypothetical protein